MNASIVDLRYRMNEILGALKRRERVSILYHGKVKGTIIPAAGETRGKVTEHPFFGMAAKDARSVEAVVNPGTPYVSPRLARHGVGCSWLAEPAA